MRKAFSVAVLVLALGCPVFAGIIHNPGPQPATSTTQGSQAPTGDYEIQNPPTVNETEASGLTEIALDLLAVLPSLL